jgi:hypothetical protein
MGVVRADPTPHMPSLRGAAAFAAPISGRYRVKSNRAARSIGDNRIRGSSLGRGRRNDKQELLIIRKRVAPESSPPLAASCPF